MRRRIKRIVCVQSLLACMLILVGAKRLRTEKNIDRSELPCMELTLSQATLKEVHHEDKTVRYRGTSLSLTDPETGTILNDVDVELRGRGNSSWDMPKKSYQIRFQKERELLGMSESKKWLLIANYADASLMRNRLVCDLAGELMDFAPESRHVELWINGEYLGNYLLMEKIEVGDGKVELEDDRGLLVEVDNFYWYEEEEQFQSPISGSHFALKEAKDDMAGEEAFAEFEAFIQEFESLLYAEEKDWEAISSMIDVESFVKYYFIEELAENFDSCRTSIYMYRDGPEDVLHMGPVWDFDKALGYSMRAKYGGDPQVDYIKNIQDYMGTEKDMTWYMELFSIPEFCEEANRIYQEQVQDVFHTADTQISQYREEIKDSAGRNFERWEITEIPENCGSEPYTYESWEEAADGLAAWVQERIAYLDESYSGK